MNTRPSENYTRLLNDGPQTYEELPHQINYVLRQDGVRKFKPGTSMYGSVVSGGGRKYAVYYIEGKHEPQTVIRKWIKANPNTVQEISDWALHQRISSYGEKWKRASRKVLGPFNIDAAGNDTTGGTCPMCGEEYELNLPDHLPCGES